MKSISNQKINSKYFELKDYKVFDYEIPEIFLDFVIDSEKVNVKTRLKLNKVNKKAKSIVLDGKDIFMIQI